MLYCIHWAAVGFIGCSAVRQPSWLSEFSEFSDAGGRLAGSGGSARSLISITSRCCLCYCLLCRLSLFSSLLFSLISMYHYSSPLFLKLILQANSRHTDSEGFVMNGILLHIRRKCTLQCGFTNCLHCPENDSLYTAENGRQPGSQTDWQHSADRLVCRAYRRTAERQFVTGRANMEQRKPTCELKRPAASTCGHKM